VYVNIIVFSELIKNLYELKGCGTKRLINEFPTKGWKITSVEQIAEKIDRHRND